MKRIRDPIFAFIIFLIGLFIIFFIFYFLPEAQKNLINYITFSGTYSSLFGIMLAYTQIISVKETTENTKEKVEESNKRTIKILSVSELSKAIKLVHEIQNYLFADKSESAIIRLKDLKSILIQIKFNTELEKLTKTETYKESLADISINMTNLTQHLIGSKSGINKTKIISDLEIIENHLYRTPEGQRIWLKLGFPYVVDLSPGKDS